MKLASVIWHTWAGSQEAKTMAFKKRCKKGPILQRPMGVEPTLQLGRLGYYRYTTGAYAG